MDNSQNSTNAQNQPQSSSASPSRPPMPSLSSAPNAATPSAARPVSPSTPPRVATTPTNFAATPARPAAPTPGPSSPSAPLGASPATPPAPNIPKSPNTVTFGQPVTQRPLSNDTPASATAGSSPAASSAGASSNVPGSAAGAPSANSGSSAGPNNPASATKPAAGGLFASFANSKSSASSAGAPGLNGAASASASSPAGSTSASSPAGSTSTFGTGPASGAAAQPGPTTDPKAAKKAKSAKSGKKISKPTIIILSVLAAVLVLGGVGLAAYMIISNQPKPETGQTPIAPPVETSVQDTLANMSAEDLLAAIGEQYSDDYIPENYLSDTLVGFLSDGSQISLLDSYATIDEFEATYTFYDDYEADVEDSGEGYVVVSAVDEDGEPVSGQPVYVAFDQTKLAYTAPETTSTTDVSLSSALSGIKLKDTSEDFVSVALPIILTSAKFPYQSVYAVETASDDSAVTYDIYSIVAGISGSINISGSVDMSDASEVTTYDENGNSTTIKSDSSSSSSETDSSSTGSGTGSSSGSDQSQIGIKISAIHIQLSVDAKTGVISIETFGDNNAPYEELNSQDVSSDDISEDQQSALQSALSAGMFIGYLFPTSTPSGTSGQSGSSTSSNNSGTSGTSGTSSTSSTSGQLAAPED